MNRTALIPLTLLLAASVPSIASAQAKKKPPVHKPPTSGVKGTAQMAGDNGKLGVAYTIGREGPLNFALTDAAYTVARVNLNGLVAPKAEDKLLVLTFTIQNPNKTETPFGWDTLHMTAVDSQGTNHEKENSVVRPGIPAELAIDLKPGQKVVVMTVIVMPGKESVPKLIVQKGDDQPVLRYDLRGKIKALAAPFADPADATGATARTEVPAQTGMAYPMKVFDVTLVTGAYTTDAIKGEQPGDGKRYFVATLTIKNQSANDAHYDWSAFKEQLLTSDGEKAENKTLLKGGRDEDAYGTLKPGEEYNVRVYFEIPNNVTAKTLDFSEGDSRVYAFDMTGVK